MEGHLILGVGDVMSSDMNEAEIIPTPLTVLKGRCFVTFAYDIGSAIHLERAERRIRERVERPQLADERRQPTYFGYNPRPVRFFRQARSEIIEIARCRADADIEVTLWDFGAATLAFRIPLPPNLPFVELATISAQLDETTVFERAGAELMEHLLTELGDSVTNRCLRDSREDYLIFELQEVSAGRISASNLVDRQARDIARIVRAERPRLASKLVQETLKYRLSYREREEGRDREGAPKDADVVVVGWNAALFFGQEDEMSVADLRAVLQFALVQLLEMRLLDEQLDHSLDEAYRIMQRRRRSFRADLSRMALIQVDAAMAFEGVNNALTLIGDEFLTDVYNLAIQRFRLLDNERSVKRKLSTLEEIYAKLADRQAQRRSEFLEITIIALIIIEIMLSLLAL